MNVYGKALYGVSAVREWISRVNGKPREKGL